MKESLVTALVTKQSRHLLTVFLTFPLHQVPPQLPSWFSALARGGQRGASLIGRSLLSGAGSQAEGSRMTGASWSPPSPSLQDDPGLHVVLSEPQDPATSEKTAAGCGSPASANQADAGNQIKTESVDDD